MLTLLSSVDVLPKSCPYSQFGPLKREQVRTELDIPRSGSPLKHRENNISRIVGIFRQDELSAHRETSESCEHSHVFGCGALDALYGQGVLSSDSDRHYITRTEPFMMPTRHSVIDTKSCILSETLRQDRRLLAQRDISFHGHRADLRFSTRYM